MNLSYHLHTLYLSGGSNLGDRLSYLQQATQAIEKRVGKIINQSSIYLTSSWANNNEPSYFNTIWVVRTTLTVEQVLQKILDIEKSLGRVRTKKWTPRTIDIDILFYDEIIVHNPPTLMVPHPCIGDRKFWLIPLQSLCPEKRHPVLQKNITQLLLECTDKGSVEQIDNYPLF